MPTLDPAVSAVLDRNGTDEEDEDALISALEDDDDHTSHAFSAFREARLQQLHAELSRAKTMRNSEGHGTYAELKDEKAVLDITTSAANRLAVVHFMKPDFARCRLMDDRLAALAPKHFDTRFVSINVENAPFLVAKLKIQVLPCVIAFVDGVGTDRIVGFEGLGYRTDDFSLQELEARLLRSGVLVRAKMVDEDEAYRYRKAAQMEQDEEYDEDE